eukprot:g9760.t1
MQTKRRRNSPPSALLEIHSQGKGVHFATSTADADNKKSKFFYVYYAFAGLMLVQVGQIIITQVQELSSSMFSSYGKTIFEPNSFKYHQYQVIQKFGVNVYSKPSLLAKSNAVLKQYSIVTGTGNILPSFDNGDDTKFVEVKKNSQYVPISSNTSYRSWPNKVNYQLVQFLELIVPKGRPKNGICEYAGECEPIEKIKQEWGKAVTTRYSQAYCCRVHTAQRYAVMEIFKVFQRHNIILFLESGTLIGQRRHNFMQVPWTFDVDLGFVVDNKVLKMATFQKIISDLVNSELPGWTFKTVHKIDKNGHGDCAQLQLSDVNNNRFDLFGYRHNHYSKEDEKKFGTDFGMLGTCFQYARSGGKYIMPPKDCKFYDMTVKCPNDIDGYIKAVYGNDALSSGVDHGWDPNHVYGFDGDETYKYHLKDIVLAKVGAWAKYYRGKIVTVKKKHLYDIHFDDGELKYNVGEKSMKKYEPVKYHLNESVFAKVGAWDKYHKGKVVKVKENNLYDIDFDNGESKYNVDEYSMKRESSMPNER